MRRAAIERPRTVSTWKRHLARHEKPVRCVCDTQVGRFRKGQRVGGCGKARCYLCHREKLMGEPKMCDLRAMQTQKEGLQEV